MRLHHQRDDARPDNRTEAVLDRLDAVVRRLDRVATALEAMAEQRRGDQR